MLLKNKIVILLFLLLTQYFGFTQDSIANSNVDQQDTYSSQPLQPNSLNKKEWTELKKKLKIKDYQPEKKKEEKKKNDTIKKNKNKGWELNISPTWRLIIKWVLFGLLLAALLFLVLSVLNINPFIKKSDANKINIGLDELEENLDTAAIDPHLYEAIKNKNYKLAIRLYYLMIIQKLALKEKIIWKKYKTNKHYLNELKNKEEYPMVKALTLTYEKCWFGEVDVTEPIYDIIHKDFVNFLQNIK
jgi:hypothetical protein